MYTADTQRACLHACHAASGRKPRCQVWTTREGPGLVPPPGGGAAVCSAGGPLTSPLLGCFHHSQQGVRFPLKPYRTGAHVEENAVTLGHVMLDYSQGCPRQRTGGESQKWARSQAGASFTGTRAALWVLFFPPGGTHGAVALKLAWSSFVLSQPTQDFIHRKTKP